MGFQAVFQPALITGLGLLFLASAIPKLRRPRSFALIVLEYRVLPPRLALPVGQMLPFFELTLAALLLTGTAARISTTLAMALCASFSLAVGANVARGREIECGCFGVGQVRRTGWPVLVQDLALLLAAGTATILAPSWLAPARWSIAHWVQPHGPVVALSAAMFVTGTIITAAILMRSKGPARPWRGDESATNLQRVGGFR